MRGKNFRVLGERVRSRIFGFARPGFPWNGVETTCCVRLSRSDGDVAAMFQCPGRLRYPSVDLWDGQKCLREGRFRSTTPKGFPVGAAAPVGIVRSWPMRLLSTVRGTRKSLPRSHVIQCRTSKTLLFKGVVPIILTKPWREAIDRPRLRQHSKAHEGFSPRKVKIDG